MVLGNCQRRIKYFFLTSIFLSFCSCGPESLNEIIFDTACFSNYKFELVAINSTCYLKIYFQNTNNITKQNSEIKYDLYDKKILKVTEKCYFNKRYGKPLFYSYPTKGVSAVFLIIGTPNFENPEVYYKSFPKGSFLGKNIQGLQIISNEIFLTKYVGTNGVCPDIALDQIWFQDFALYFK